MKKRKTIFYFVAIIIAVFLTNSCKKYEDGPFISFRSKEERITNTWKHEKSFDNGVAITPSEGIYHEFTKDGKYKYISENNYAGHFVLEGTWEFKSEKTEMELNIYNPPSPNSYLDTWKILRLKEKELWIERRTGSRFDRGPFYT